MTRTLGLSLAVVLFGGSAVPVMPSNSYAAAGGSSSVPAFNVEAMCRDLSKDTRVNYESCIAQERTALAQLKQTWMSFSAGSRGDCIKLIGASSLASYVTLQDCLQTSRDAKNLLKNDPIGNLTHEP